VSFPNGSRQDDSTVISLLVLYSSSYAGLLMVFTVREADSLHITTAHNAFTAL
jgi:hypothetical protein